MPDSADTRSPFPSVLEPQVADEPFNDAAADIVLRTSDKVDFYVYRVILSLASPFFKDMFSLPQSKSASDPCIGDGSTAYRPIIDISEDSRTMDFVLHFCYPLRKPIMTELKDVGPVLLAAYKYDMQAVLDAAKIILEQCVKQDTLGVFALACRCELHDVCSKAAGQFVQHPLLSLNSKELDFIEADRYRQLLEYHQRYAKDESPVIPPEAWCNSQLSVKQQPSSPALSNIPPSGSPVPSLAPPRDTDTPFDDETADVVLRSSDQVDFHVQSFILSFASPVFKDMILDHSQALTAGAVKPPLIINVPEDSRTLDVFLRCCYPVRPSRLTQLSEARLLLAAGLKYDVDAVKALAEVSFIEFVDQDILGVWSMALRYGLRDACLAAARCFLQYPLMSLNSVELGSISARHYHELLQYHRRCGEAAAAVADSRTWFCENMSLSNYPSAWRCCSGCSTQDPSGNSHWHAPPSLWKYLDEAKGALKARPTSFTVLSREIWSKWTSSWCDRCIKLHCRDTTFSHAFSNEVDRVILEVDVPNFF